MNFGWPFLSLPLSFTDNLPPHERGPWNPCRLTEETSSLVPPNKPESDRWSSRDVAALAARLATSPVFVDLEASGSALEAASLGGPIPGQTRISLRQDFQHDPSVLFFYFY